MVVAKKYQDALKRIKENVKVSHEYFEENYRRWHEFIRFVFLTSLTDSDVSLLKKLKKPQLEFNVLEAYISRMLGEFSKQEPSVNVRSVNGGSPVDAATTDLIEGYMRNIEAEARENGTLYRIYKDLLGGGFSVAKVWTEYTNSMSFEQQIRFDRAYDPTMCGFDPKAQLPSKSDGHYCYEIFPRTEQELKDDGIDTKKLTFRREVEGFNWSYSNMKEKIALVIDYYEKKKKKVRIVNVAPITPGGQPHVMTEDAYKQMIEQWEEMGNIAQAPVIIGKPRTTEIEVIHRYKIIEDEVLEHKITDFKYLPLTFIDGNSVVIRSDEKGKSMTGVLKQYTRPYIYQAKGAQSLKNFAGITLANEIENMVQHKFKIPKEGIPPEYKDAYVDFQTPNTIVYNQFKDDNPDIRLDAPQEIARIPTPPEVANTFMATDQIIQAALGSYDASLGINNNQLSGVAIVEGATQSNAAAMPYVVSLMQGMTHIFNIILDLIPKYIKTPRTIPIIGKDGKRTFKQINQPGEQPLKYSSDALHVTVEAGVNFAIQKSRTLQQITAMSQSSQIFAQFINTVGLPIIIDNLELRGADQLKTLAEEFIQQQKQQQAQAAQAGQQNPQLINAKVNQMKVMQQGQQNQADNAIKAAQVSVDNKKADNDKLKIIADAHDNVTKQTLERDKIDAERTGQAVEYAVKAADMDHRHTKETMELAHKILPPAQEEAGEVKPPEEEQPIE
jgi:hypothetical protein